MAENANAYPPLVSVVVVHLGARDLLENLLARLFRSNSIEQVETIVVDNASETPGLEKLVDSYSGIRLVRLSHRKGYSAATNAGIAASVGKYILWCNNDLVFEPDMVERLVGFMEAHPNYAVAGPQLINLDGSYQPSFSLLDINLRLLIMERIGLAALKPNWDIKGHQKGHEVTPQDVAVAAGACCLLRRAALEQVGGLDERFFLYAEEFDVCYRLRRAGWRIRYLPQARAMHLGGQTTTKTVRHFIFMVQSWRSNFAYIRKHYGSGSECILSIAVAGGALARCFVVWVQKNWIILQQKPELAQEYRMRLRFHAYIFHMCMTSKRHEASRLPNVEHIFK